MKAAVKQQIDDMPYETMLSLCRGAPLGHPMFSDAQGDYFIEVMNKKRSYVDHVAASKNIG